eukprot:3679939-Ditylum_brightwellii.AAC.1
MYSFDLDWTQFRQRVLAEVTALSDDEEKQEENDDIMQCLCRSVVNLRRSPVNNGDGRIRQRDRDDFDVEVLGEVILLAHNMG